MKTFLRDLEEALEIIGNQGITDMRRGELTPEQKEAFTRLVLLARRFLAASQNL